MRQPHARPMWEVQSEEIRRYARRERRRRKLRKGAEYAGYIASALFFVWLVLWALQEV